MGKKFGDIPRGIFIVRGENVVLLGEMVSTDRLIALSHFNVRQNWVQQHCIMAKQKHYKILWVVHKINVGDALISGFLGQR